MKFNINDAEFFVPDGASPEEALSRATILAIGAHPDDIEILAIPGIIDAIRTGGNQLLGVVATNGGGALRTGCLLYTSDAADDLLCVDLGGRRIIKKKK